MGDQGLKRRGAPDGGGWAETGMRWLGTATQVVEVSLAWWLATLVGVGLLGWLPASVAAVRVLGPIGTEDASTLPLGEFVTHWKSQFIRANLVGWPATIALAVLGLNAWVLSVGGQPWMAPMLVATLCVAVWLMMAIAYLVVILTDDRSREVSALKLWRAALAIPLTSPATALAWGASAASLLVVASRFPILFPLAVPGLLALLASWLMRRRLDQAGILTDDDSRTTTSKSASR